MVLPLAADMFRQRGRESADCAEGGADAGDDHSSDRDGDERAEEAGGEEAPPDPGQGHQFEGDRGQCRGQRGAVGRDQEWQGMQDAAEERARPGDLPAQERVAAPGQVPVSDRPSEKAMLTPAPIAVASPAKNA